VPNLYQDGRIDFTLAMSVGGEFDHRRISAESLIAEAQSWGVLSRQRIPILIEETLVAIKEALGAVRAPDEISNGLPERIGWNLSRLRSGAQISAPKGQGSG
jgi:serine/threonine-protein kinase HipA